MLKTGTLVEATIIAAPSSTKNKEGELDPEMQQTKKGNQWHFGMKAHIDVVAESGLVNTVTGTAANVNDATQAADCCMARRSMPWGDAGCKAWTTARRYRELSQVALGPAPRQAQSARSGA